MGEVLQRWRCPDCAAVFDVFVDEATGRAAEMKTELCPTCQHGGKLSLGQVDLKETALYHDSGISDDPCAFGHLIPLGASRCVRCSCVKDPCRGGNHDMSVGGTACVRCGWNPE